MLLNMIRYRQVTMLKKMLMMTKPIGNSWSTSYNIIQEQKKLWCCNHWCWFVNFTTKQCNSIHNTTKIRFHAMKQVNTKLLYLQSKLINSHSARGRDAFLWCWFDHGLDFFNRQKDDVVWGNNTYKKPRRTNVGLMMAYTKTREQQKRNITRIQIMRRFYPFIRLD